MNVLGKPHSWAVLEGSADGLCLGGGDHCVTQQGSKNCRYSAFLNGATFSEFIHISISKKNCIIVKRIFKDT